MTTKQAKRFFHRNARVMPNGRWRITYVGATLGARTCDALRAMFVRQHAGMLANRGLFSAEPYSLAALEAMPITMMCNLAARELAHEMNRAVDTFVARRVLAPRMPVLKSTCGCTIGPNAPRLIAEAIERELQRDRSESLHALFVVTPPAFGGSK
jgi:DNA-binding transcriptional regulator PaaX